MDLTTVGRLQNFVRVSISLVTYAIPNFHFFGTTYVCEQAFSKLKYVKSTHRSKLTDKHLKAILLIGCSNSKPNTDDILKGKLWFHKSH